MADFKKLAVTAVMLSIIIAVVSISMYSFVEARLDWAWYSEMALAAGLGFVVSGAVSGLGNYLMRHQTHRD